MTKTPEWNDVEESLPDTDRWVRAITKWFDRKADVKDREVTVWYSKEEYFKAHPHEGLCYEWDVSQWRDLRDDEPKEFEDKVGDKLEKEMYEKFCKEDEEGGEK